MESELEVDITRKAIATNSVSNRPEGLKQQEEEEESYPITESYYYILKSYLDNYRYYFSFLENIN